MSMVSSIPTGIHDRSTGPIAILGIILMAVVFLTCAHRAYALGITHDEALTYNLFASQPWGKIVFGQFDANHHILHTYLVKLSVELFGASELSMRLPALLGSLLYLIMFYRLSKLLFGYSASLLAALTIATINPLVFEFLSAGRGYSIALGFLTYALYHLVASLVDSEVGFLTEDREWHKIKAAIGLGLSVSANLAFFYVSFSLAGLYVFAIMLEAFRQPRWTDPVRAVKHLMMRFCLPGILAFAILCCGPLSSARKVSFYAGTDTFYSWFQQLFSYGLRNSSGIEILDRLLPYLSGWTVFLVVLMKGLLLALVLWLVWAVVLTKRNRSFMELHWMDRAGYLLSGASVLTIVQLVLGHYVFHLNYPPERASIYFLPVLFLAGLMLLRRVSVILNPHRVLLAPFYLCFLVTALAWAPQIRLDHFIEWRYDSSTRKVFYLLHEAHRTDPPQSVRLGITWIYEPSLNFYRRLTGQWMVPVNREGPEGSYDYYVLSPHDHKAKSLLARGGLRTLYTDPLSGSIVAVRGSGSKGRNKEGIDVRAPKQVEAGMPVARHPRDI